MKKVILKITSFNINFETRRALREKVVEQLNTDGVAIVPEWCDVIVLDDIDPKSLGSEDK